MAEPILKLTRGVPKTDREWMDVFSKITKHLRVQGDKLVIQPEIELPASAANSVLGRSASTPGAPEDIIAGSDGTYLKRTGGALAFAAIVDADIPSTIARDSEVSAAVSAHEALSDPHPNYTTAAELAAALSPYPLTNGTVTITGAWAFALPPVLPEYSVATVPSAAMYERALIYVSDETGGAVPAFSDGTDWRRVTDRAVIS